MELKKILITGGSRGIGRALIDQFQREDVEIHSVSRSISKDLDSRHRQYQFDLSSNEKVQEFIKKFIDENGVPDLLINNAGSGAFYKWDEFPIVEIERQINLLFTVPVLFCREIAPLMAKQEKGIIVNISSLATLYPLPFMPLYNAGKAALSSFTQTMMLEYDNHPIFFDFRLGDISSEFNNAQSKQKKINWTEKMKRAWIQIEKQLIHSPSPQYAAKKIYKVIFRKKSGVYYAGGFLQSRIAPTFARFLNQKALKFLLHNRYFR